LRNISLSAICSSGEGSPLNEHLISRPRGTALRRNRRTTPKPEATAGYTAAGQAAGLRHCSHNETGARSVSQLIAHATIENRAGFRLHRHLATTLAYRPVKGMIRCLERRLPRALLHLARAHRFRTQRRAQSL